MSDAPELFEVLYAFDPPSRMFGELPLQPGELLTLGDRTSEGWASGEKVKTVEGTTELAGWFPLSNVQQLCGTMCPTRTGRLALFEQAAQRLVRFDPKASRLRVDLSGFRPPLDDDDLATFARWLAPRLSGQRGRCVVELDLSRGAFDAGVGEILDVLRGLEIPVEGLSVRGGQLAAAGLAHVRAYLLGAAHACALDLRDNPQLDAASTASLLAALRNHPAYVRARDGVAWAELGVQVGSTEASAASALLEAPQPAAEAARDVEDCGELAD